MPAAISIVAAAAGFAGSVLLGWPAFSELRDRKNWEALRNVKARAGQRSRSAGGAGPGPDFTQIQWDFLEDRLGRYYSNRVQVIGGFILLAGSFLLTLVEKVLGG